MKSFELWRYFRIIARCGVSRGIPELWGPVRNYGDFAHENDKDRSQHMVVGIEMKTLFTRLPKLNQQDIPL